jgi:glycosyltransferase involved in cell wall biosynthesis
VSSPRITFAIPFHRGLAWLGEAIESVRAQRIDAWRAVVLDDRGETSGTAAELVASFRDPRIECRVNATTLGMVANFNQGLEASSTELVTLLHSDDRLLPDYAELMLALADARPRAAALCCAAEIIDDAGRPHFSLPDAVKRLLLPAGDPWTLAGEAGLRALLRGDFVMCPTLCWRRSVLGSRRFDPSWHQVQDLELLVRLLLDGAVIVGSRRRAYAYRRHAGSATALQSESLLRFDEEFALYGRLAAQTRALGWRSAARVAERAAIVRLHLGFRAAADLAALRPRRALRKLAYLLRAVPAAASGGGGAGSR